MAPNTFRPLHAVEVELLELYLGRNHAQFATEGQFYLHYLELAISTAAFDDTLTKYLHPDFHPQESYYLRMLRLICLVIRVYRGSGDMGIDGVLREMRRQGAFQVGPVYDGDDIHQLDDTVLKVLIFSILGWVSMLFQPSYKKGTSKSFCIINSCPASSLRTDVPIEERCKRPLDELLRAFGEFLPKSMPVDDRDSSELSFQVSYLNASTLQSIGGITITWVNSMSDHLLFDASNRSLWLFRLPSVCRLQQSDLSILTILLRSFYLEGEEPDPNFSVSDVMGEILLSYTLLFGDSRSSRIMYKKTERRRAALEAGKMTSYSVDPTLDKLCGLNNSKPNYSFNQPVREVYSSTVDFPIFSDRLKKLQHYMQNIQPNRTMSLWRDRRDLRLWYTIWLVVILGAISIVQAFVALGVAIAQLRIAQDAYALQQRQQQGLG